MKKWTYCGVEQSDFGLLIAARKSAAWMSSLQSIEDAIQNAKRHSMDNVRYEVGKAEDIMPKWTKEGFCPDIVVVDPPRSGLDKKLMDTILKTAPKRIVYVNSNPSTLAKDLEYMGKAYRPKYIQPVDMFPQTSHVECVVEIVKRV